MKSMPGSCHDKFENRSLTISVASSVYFMNVTFTFFLTARQSNRLLFLYMVLNDTSGEKINMLLDVLLYGHADTYTYISHILVFLEEHEYDMLNCTSL